MTSTRPVSRRTFLRAAGGGATTLAATQLLDAPGASAGRAWCRVDPVVLIDGQLADIFLGSSTEMLLSATGPIKLRISIPEGSRGRVVLTDLGFGRGYDIAFSRTAALTRGDGRTPVIVEAYAPARADSLPVTVTFAPRTLDSSLADILFGMTAEGTANQWITLVP